MSGGRTEASAPTDDKKCCKTGRRGRRPLRIGCKGCGGAGDRKGRPYGGLQGVRGSGRPRGSPLRRVARSACVRADVGIGPYGSVSRGAVGGPPQGSSLPGVCVYIIYLYNKAVFFCDVKKIFCRRGKSAAKERDFQMGSEGVRTGKVFPCGRCRCKGAGGIRALFAMQKHSKIRNVPFPRPGGATGNDAQKTSRTGICAFSWCSVPA